MDQPLEEKDDEEVRDIDRKKKERTKEYADTRRHAKTNTIKVGDVVLVKRQKPSNKLATTFEPTRYRVVERSGSEVVVENTVTSTRYRRNVAHTKRVEDEIIEQDGDDINNQVQVNGEEEMSTNQPVNTSESEVIPIRSSRKRKAPDHLKYYKLN